MSIPTVVTWTDSGAPTIRRVASSLIAVLDFCLPQRGWVKEWSDVDRAVYRAGSGQRKFYRFLNDSTVVSSTGTTYNYASITGYDTMTGVDTGSGWGATHRILLSQITDTPRPWICIFNETAVFIIVFTAAETTSTLSTCSASFAAFGETLPGLPGQTARNFIACQTSNQINMDFTGLIKTNFAAIAVDRSIDGTRTNIIAKLKSNGGDNGGTTGTDTGSYPVGNWSYCPLSYPYYGELLYGRPMIDDAVTYSMGDYIPGLYYPCQKGGTFDSAATYTSSTKSFMAFWTSGSNTPFVTRPTTLLQHYGALLIDLGDWG